MDENGKEQKPACGKKKIMKRMEKPARGKKEKKKKKKERALLVWKRTAYGEMSTEGARPKKQYQETSQTIHLLSRGRKAT